MIALYPRVSTQEQAKEGYSIDEQVERLKNYCKAMGWNEYKFYTDAGYSGGNTDRPALQELIRDVKLGKINKVVVYKLDRLSRSQLDTLYLIEKVFLANNCDFVSMSENFDTGTPFGRAMIGILAVFAQLEREQIKERMSMGREGRAKEGKWHGGPCPPIGYDYIDSELVVNEYEAMQVRDIFNLFVAGNSIRSIEKMANDKGYRHKYGTWYQTKIRQVLLNKIYIGKVEFNGQCFDGIHDAIIDADTFETAQTILANRKRTPSGTKRPTFLGGLIFCKKCGARYSINAAHNRYYTCNSRRKQNWKMVIDPNCKNKIYRMEILDEIVLDEIKKLALEPDCIHEIKRENFSQADMDKETILKKEIVKIDTQISRFMDLYGIGKFTAEQLTGKTEPLNEQRKKLEAELQALTADKSNMTEDDVFEIVSTFNDILERGKYEEIRLVIESLIDRIDIDDDNVYIHWKFA